MVIACSIYFGELKFLPAFFSLVFSEVREFYAAVGSLGLSPVGHTLKFLLRHEYGS
jgi:hypothetical protein